MNKVAFSDSMGKGCVLCGTISKYNVCDQCLQNLILKRYNKKVLRIVRMTRHGHVFLHQDNCPGCLRGVKK